MYTIEELYDLSHTYPEAAAYFRQFRYPWEALPGIGNLILKVGASLDPAEYDHPSETVWIAKDAVIAPTAFIGECVIVGPKTEVRHGAFIRGKALIGNCAVIGNSVELKNVIIFDAAEVPHFNYVGDSILGYHAHMGAGSVTSNVRSDRKNVVVRDGSEAIETGLRKVGAMLGDHAEIGCNAVLNPGAIVGRNAMVYPTACVRGTVPQSCIFKNSGEIIEKKD